MNTGTIPKRRTASESSTNHSTSSREKTAPNRKSHSPQLSGLGNGQRRSPRNQSPLGSPNRSPKPLQSPVEFPMNSGLLPQDTQLPNKSPVGKFFPDLSLENSLTSSLEVEVSSPAGEVPTPEAATDDKTVEIDPQEPEKKQGHSLQRCPCGVSSGGKSWILECTQCRQKWHNGCANLKGDIPKNLFDSIDQWQCPWCYTCPFTPPTKHKSSKSSTDIKAIAVTDALIDRVEESVKGILCTEVQRITAEQSKAILESIGSQVEGIVKKTVSNEMANSGSSSSSLEMILPPDNAMNSTPPELTCIEPEPITDYRKDFLPLATAAEVDTFLRQSLPAFTKKFKGRSTLCFGAQYSYKGSNQKPVSKEIPPVLCKLIEKITEDYQLPAELIPNSVLVNHFPKKERGNSPPSELPAHSDNELEIEPGSSIFTYSCGATRQLTFSGIHSETTCPMDVIDNSLYSMSKMSQAFFKHQILDVESCDARFSITMRCIKEANTRSILLVGDSNTKPIEFGTGKGKVGEKYPGKRIKAARIKNINPADCTEHSNIVISCGTNDLRPDEIKGNPAEYLSNLVACLKDKVEQINLLNPGGKIFVMPVLPTRDHKMNKFVTSFNKALLNSAFIKKLGIWMPPLYSFLDHMQLLNIKLTRNGDTHHLGEQGLNKFVRCLKDAIYLRERECKESEHENVGWRRKKLQGIPVIHVPGSQGSVR